MVAIQLFAGVHASVADVYERARADAEKEAITRAGKIQAAADNEMTNVRQQLIDDAVLNMKVTNAGLIQKAKRQISSRMKDPDSTKFSGVKIFGAKEARVVCGEVNAKNSYGGYVGAVPFVSDGEKINIVFGSDEMWRLKMTLAAGRMAEMYAHPAFKELCK